jgi:hypothetical protein
MTIDEALIIIKKEQEYYRSIGWMSECDALGLGIEALKRIKAYKESPLCDDYQLLLGETEK